MKRGARDQGSGVRGCKLLITLLAGLPLFGGRPLVAQQRQPSSAVSGRQSYEANCARCHGADGGGGELGPDILHSATARVRSERSLRELIRAGIPAAGMPAFSLPPAGLQALAAYVRALIAPAADHPTAGDTAAGMRFFLGAGGCTSCHMVRGSGGWSGPDLSDLARQRTALEIEQALTGSSPGAATGYQVASVRLRDGRTRRGVIRNESSYEIELQGDDGTLTSIPRELILEITREPKASIHRLQANDSQRRDLMAYLTRLAALPGRAPSEWSSTAEPSFDRIVNPAAGEWPSYHGRLTGNRHSPLDQINRANVASLKPLWLFPIPGSAPLEVTPVVVDGVMYVTTANRVYALDAATGRRIWQYARPRTPGLVGDAAGGINRGVAVLRDRLFLVTDNAHLIALHRTTGGLIWDVEMADSRKHYGATSAPLVVNDLVISGTSGGDEGARGFIAAYRAATGEEVWRFWVVPAPGEPQAETWVGRAIEHGCGAAWLTGTYDPETGLLFWTTGNPCPDYNGDERRGDNLYSSSVLALRPDNGRLAWYYQYTPHDLHDWDAAQTPMIVDAPFGGRERKLLLQANRNGFFYVLDRTDGTLLLAKPFVQKLTWASGIGQDGRPQLIPDAEPTTGGTRACPAVEGATNWMSSAFNPATGLFYVMALEKCSIYSKSSAWWEPGKSFYGGATRDVPGEPGEKHLRAIDIQTGRIVWDYPQIGPGDTWGGVLSTAGGLVIFGDDSGALAAVDAVSGSPLWHFHTNQKWKASPMTYLEGGRQYVAVAAGSEIIAFGLP
ncbi:MAG: PQQ-binding-like beta-propeller repeat protein [Gemmatimonadetes bacterium]|nr:PQQ-binding-like beta-propeller repeat protein [Gemmatimonadota bacterium]